MKMIVLSVSLLVLAMSVVPNYAARPTPSSTQPVVSEYFTFSFAGLDPQVQDFALLTVPEGKTFVLVEVFARSTSNENSETFFSVLKDAESRFAPSQGSFGLQFNSGMTVSAGSTLTIRASYQYRAQSTNPGAWSEGYIFASGYLYNN